MDYCIICPFCGMELLKAGNGSEIEIVCPRCNEKYLIKIEGNNIEIQIITEDPSDKE